MKQGETCEPSQGCLLQSNGKGLTHYDVVSQVQNNLCDIDDNIVIQIRAAMMTIQSQGLSMLWKRGVSGATYESVIVLLNHYVDRGKARFSNNSTPSGTILALLFFFITHQTLFHRILLGPTIGVNCTYRVEEVTCNESSTSQTISIRSSYSSPPLSS